MLKKILKQNILFKTVMKKEVKKIILQRFLYTKKIKQGFKKSKKLQKMTKQMKR
jgi:hypothetical protein